MSIFCLSSLFSKLFSRKDNWSLLPEEVKERIVEQLELRDKTRFSMTSKSIYDTVKNVPTQIHWLQFSPIRYNAKCAEVIVFFNENDNFSFYFEKKPGGSSLKVSKNGEFRSVKTFKRDFREVADECFQGWLKGSKINSLDVRGDYQGTIPPHLQVSEFSFVDKYYRPSTAIPAWLDSIQDGEVYFMLMSDHWDTILTHQRFSNPKSSCKLTGYDGIGHEHLLNIQSKRIELNNIKDEQPFNILIKKWTTGGFPDTFDWLTVTSVTRPLRSERLLAEIRIQGLDSRIFEEADRDMQEHDTVEYFLVFGQENHHGVFCGIDNFARFRVINKELVTVIPELAIYFFEKPEVSKAVPDAPEAPEIDDV